MKNYLFLIALVCFLIPILSVTAAEEANAETNNHNGGGHGGGGGHGDGCGGGRHYGDRWNWGCNTCWCDHNGVHCTNHRCHYTNEEPKL